MSTAPVVAAAPKLTFFKRLVLDVEKIFKRAPAWENAALTTVTYVAPLVETGLLITDPAVAVIVNPLIEQVKTDLTAASIVIKAAGPAPTVQTYLSAVLDNLALIEGSAQVKDSASAAKITATTQLIGGEIQSILTAIQDATAASVSQAAAPTPAAALKS